MAKCSDCNHRIFEKSNGSPNRYYCKHPIATKMGSKMICRTDRGSTVLKVKTSPKWCPLRISNS